MICWCSDFPATIAGSEDDAAAASGTSRSPLPRPCPCPSPCKKRRARALDVSWLDARAHFSAREIRSSPFLPVDRSGFLVLLWEISMLNYCSH